MLAWSVSCRHNNPIIVVNAVLSRELCVSVDLFILANKFKKRCLFFQSRSLVEPLATSRGTLGFRETPVEKPWFKRIQIIWKHHICECKVEQILLTEVCNKYNHRRVSYAVSLKYAAESLCEEQNNEIYKG
jgi:hypothetical protein